MKMEPNRADLERKRRNQMKALYSKLNSLVPHQTSREAVSLPDQLEEAANYIKKLQANLEKMKQKKESLMSTKMLNTRSTSGTMADLRLPQIEIHENGSALGVVLITTLDSQFMFNETMRLLHEEGAEVVHASFSVLHDTAFHTLHAKVETASGCGAARISERLKKFVHDANYSYEV